MRIALISDIHGNLVALKIVLADLAAQDVDELVCLGDVALMGPQPAEVVARLRGLGCAVVMGNTDAGLLRLAEGEDPRRATSLSRSRVHRLPWALPRRGGEVSARAREGDRTPETEMILWKQADAIGADALWRPFRL